MKAKMFSILILFFGVVVVSEILSQAEVFAQVDTVWVRRYNGPGDGSDWASAIAVDGYGNVYVTGNSVRSGVSNDYTTIRYYANGDTAWVRRYNGPGNGADYAQAVAIDHSGNICVTGQTYDSTTFDDYTTIKYYLNGNIAWLKSYNGPGNYDDQAFAITVDNSDNIYVTGASTGSGTGYDYATVKYYPNGDTAWVRRYNGPGNSNDDVATAIAIDASGNVYVTGRSMGSSSNWDYATVKYYSNGNIAWVSIYNGPGNSDDEAYDIAVDDSGNVLVTGYSYTGTATSADYTTVKYYSNGETAWVRRYNGPGNDWDEARAMAIDGSNNVYVTGVSVGAGEDEDWATIKYYPNGDTAWVRRYDGPGHYSDQAYAIAVDELNNVYVTGYSGVGASYDYTTIKYYPDGDIAWLRTYDGPGNGTDYAQALALDGSNNVYVTGGSRGNGTYYDYATIKYRQYYLTDGITMVGFSPIDLIVTDPQGDSIGLTFNTIPGATYDTTQDYNHDGDKDDIVTISNRLVGDYMIRVVAEPGGGGVYSLGVRIDGSNTVMLSTGHPCPSPDEVDTFFYNAPWYMAGDANGDWQVNSADAAYLINYLFVGGPAPQPWQKGDVNCDGVINSADVSYLINYLFVSGPPPSC
jgi:hypothetical protein